MLSINNSILSQSVYGMNQATQKVAKASQNLAKLPIEQNQKTSQNANSIDEQSLNINDKITLSSNIDPVKEIISLMEGEIAYKANAKGIKTGDEMLGSVLDIKI